MWLKPTRRLARSARISKHWSTGPEDADEMLLPPGYSNIESMKRIRAAKVTGATSDRGPGQDRRRHRWQPQYGAREAAEYQDLAGFNTRSPRRSSARCLTTWRVRT
jgi:hypothetical protein